MFDVPSLARQLAKDNRSATDAWRARFECETPDAYAVLERHAGRVEGFSVEGSRSAFTVHFSPREILRVACLASFPRLRYLGR
jgi:hypothetical protein